MTSLQPRPALGEPARYVFPKPTRVKVGSGTVIALDLPGQPYAAVRLVHPAGANIESDEYRGAAMLVSEALEDGVDGNSSLAPALERYGAEWVSRVGWDSFITGVDAPTKRLKDAVALLGEAVRSPALRPDDIVRRRDQLAERFRLENSVASTLAARAVGSQLFTGRYAVPLSGGDVYQQRLTPDLARSFHTDHIAAVTGTLIVVGDLSGVNLEELGAAVFGTSDEDEAVEALDKFLYEDLGLASTLKDAGIENTDAADMAASICKKGKINGYLPLDEKAVTEILEACV